MNFKDHLNLYLTPRPKRIDVFGECLVRPHELVICAPDDDLWSMRAAKELSLFIHAKTGVNPRITTELPGIRHSKPCIILLAEKNRELFRDQFQAPFFDDFNLYPGFQSYRMRCMVGDSRILIQGLAEEGVYWGMKTLKQLMMIEKRMIVVPQAMIVDGADMEERGIWTNAFSLKTSPCPTISASEKYFREWIDWMSDHKLNLVEVVGIGQRVGLAFKSRKYPEFSSPDVKTTEPLMQRLIQYGEERGMRMIPVVSHTEHMAFISKRFPEVAPSNPIMHHGHSIGLPINYFNKKAAEVLKYIVEEMVASFKPRGICFWVAEDRLHPLSGKGQRNSYFAQEVKVFAEVAAHIKKTLNHNFEYRILLSQGSYPENLQLIRSLPRDVKWIFYSGERRGTYTVRPINPVNADIAQAAAEGYWISLCNSIRGVKARPTVFEILHQNIGHAIKAGLKAVDGMSYVFPADKQALFITAQDTWNYEGRSLDDTLTAYAAALQSKDPVAHAQAYRLADRASFAQVIRDTVGVGHPFGNFSRFYNMIERIKNNDKVDELIMIMADTMEVDDIPALSNAAADIEKALALMDAKADRIGYLRCQYLLHTVRVCLAVTNAFYINCREKSWDLYKGPWHDFREEIKILIGEIDRESARSTPLFHELVKLEKWGVSDQRSDNPMVNLAAFAKSIDPGQITSSRELKA